MSQKQKERKKKKNKRTRERQPRLFRMEDVLNNMWYAELRSEYLKKGGDELVFDALLAPEDLPEWCKSWNSMSDENYESRMDEAVKKHLLESFLEYEVLERSGGVLGTAICKVGEIKVAKGQTSLKIIHLAASDDRYEKWAQENFNVESGYQLHLCKKVDDEGSCVARPLSGKVTWCHVRKWRLLSLVDCGEVDYAKAASIDWLVKLLQEVEAAEQKKRQEKREALPENKDDEETRPEAVEDAKETEASPQFGDAAGGRRAKTAKATDKARELAVRAARGLSRGEPSLLKVPPRMELGPTRKEKEVQKEQRKVSPQKKDGGDWRDNISPLGRSEDLSPLPSAGRDGPPERPDRGRSRSRGRRGDPGGGGRHPGGGDGPGDGDQGRGSGKKAKEPSEEKDVSKVRAALVVPPRRKRRRHNPDDSPGSSGGSKRGSGRDRDRRRKDRKRDDSRGRRRRRRSSSSSKSSGGSDEDFYGKESRKFASLLQKAQKHPGNLLRSGLEEMNRYLVARSGEDNQAGGSWRNQRVTAYLSQVLFTQYSPQTMEVRNSREFLTLAEAIDQLMSQNFAAVGDLLMQRFKALESSLGQGWSVARHQELIRPEHATLTRPEEMAFAARAALQQSRLEEAVKRRRSG